MPKVNGHSRAAIILNTKPLFLKYPIERSIADKQILNPKPPINPKTKNDNHLSSLCNG